MKRVTLIWLAMGQMLAATCGAATNTAFFDMVRAGDVEKVKALLQGDIKLAKARTEDNSTALHLAALEGQGAIARLLLESKAEVNARGLRGETPLHMAMYDGHREVAEVLLESRADVNAQNTAGETPLHLAARNGYRELVELLLSQNANPGMRDNAGRTPKMAAAEKERGEITELLTFRVGDFHEVRRIVFEGAKTFPAEEMRAALQETRDFFQISHPLAPQEAYLEAIQQNLLVGYQHHGFPEARIEAQLDAPAKRIVVKVEEGPRYKCGAVKVTGAQQVPAALIVERLTRAPVPAKADQQAFDFKDKAPATNPLTLALQDESTAEKPMWVKGRPAPFSNPDLRKMKEQVTEVMRGRGFLSPKVNVMVVPAKAGLTAELQVEVLEEGPRAVIGRIEITGNKTNTAEAVLRYLDLKPGMELSSQLLATVEDRLWRAARFLDYKVTVGPQEAGGEVRLQIELAEYEEAPSLAQAFSPTEEAMLKLREWLSKLDESGEDMISHISGIPAPAPEVDLVLSARSGLALLAKDVSRKIEAQDEYAVVLKAGQAGFYSPIGGRKLLLDCPKTQLRGYLEIVPNPVDTNREPFHISVGAGFSALKEGASAASAYQFQLGLPPVVCIGLAHRGIFSNWFDGDVLIRSNATLFLKLNARSGRILEFRSAKELGDMKIQLHFEPGAFAGAAHHIETATAALPDLADTNAALSSAMMFLMEEVGSSRYLVKGSRANLTSESAVRWPALLRMLKPGEVLAPLNRLTTVTEGHPDKPDAFSVPEERGPGDNTLSDFLALITGWFLHHTDELFAARSWPWTVLREASFTLQGKGRYTDQALAEIYESSETGPLGYLAIAKVLGRIQPPLARKFAARGLERLSPSDFRHDWSMFLTGNSVFNQCVLRLADALRDLNPEQAAALAKLQSPARGEYIQECWRRLRAAKDQTVADALAPALDTYWEGELKEMVAAALRAQTFDPEETFQEGVAADRAMPPDSLKAAKLFAQAAASGHPGAQYFLARSYHQGAGVPRNITTALKWYGLSATNGCVEAAVELGNYYDEGLEIKPDHAEAFVWYSVAAGRGHRMAEAFRNGARRKLTDEQAAEAQKRVSAILSSRPNGGKAQMPAASSEH